MRRYCMVLVSCSLFGLTAPVRAQEQPARGITLRASQLSFSTTMRMLSRLTGDQYLVEGPLQNVPIDLVLQGIPAADASTYTFGQLEKSIPGLIIEKRKEVWYFKLREGAPLPAYQRKGAGASGKVTVLFGSARLRKSVDRLFAEAPDVPKPGSYQVEIERDVLDTPVSLQHTANNEGEVVDLLTRMAGSSQRDLLVERMGERLTIGIRPGVRPEIAFNKRAVAPDQPKERRIVCLFEQFDLQDAAEMVVARARTSYGPLMLLEVSDPIPDLKINFSLITNDPEVLLQSFLAEARKQVKGLDFTRTADKVVLTYRRP